MSLWNLSNNQEVEKQGSFEIGGGSTVPEGKYLALIDRAEWKEFNGVSYISTQWNILDASHKGRKVFRNINVNHDDTNKSDREKRFLAAVGTNCGGGIFECENPSDSDLQKHLSNKPMYIMVLEFEDHDEENKTKKKTNWISAVSPKKEQGAAPKGSEVHVDFDEDIDF